MKRPRVNPYRRIRAMEERTAERILGHFYYTTTDERVQRVFLTLADSCFDGRMQGWAEYWINGLAEKIDLRGVVGYARRPGVDLELLRRSR